MVADDTSSACAGAPAGGQPQISAQRRLIVRLAQDKRDLAAVQRLRYRVFAEEMGADIAPPSVGLDIDAFDELCDHLLVIDEDAPAAEAVVGTYRLLRESVARGSQILGGGFYSEGEFNLAPLTATRADPSREMVELGRSCVLAPYRTAPTISLLWRGIAEYLTSHRISMMFGCASFPGTDPDMFAPALSWLYHHHLLPVEQRPTVLPGKGVAMERLAAGSYDTRHAMFQLPPLIKGYIRVGAMFGDGAFIDHAFNTVDVCVVMPVERIANRYAARFSVAA